MGKFIVKLMEKILSEPVEGISPGWGTRNLTMSEGGEFCSLATGLVFSFCFFFYLVVTMEDLNLWHLSSLHLPSGMKHSKKY